MVDFLDEVKEEMRRDRQIAALRKYGPTVAGLVVVFVLAAALASWYLAYERGVQEQASIGFFDVMAQEALPQNLPVAGAGADAEANLGAMNVSEQFEAILEDGVKGFSELAGLRQAAILATVGEYEAAVQAYDAIAANSSHDEAIRELASLQAVGIMIDHYPTTEGNDITINTRLESLSEDKKPWRYSAKELMAFRAMDTGDTERALRLFEQLRDDQDTPGALFKRALKMVNLLDTGVGKEPEDMVEAPALEAAE